MAIDTTRIRDLLGSGLSNDTVAKAVGCSASYISQLMSDANFADEVIALRTKTLTANSARDRRIDDIEDALIERVQQVVEAGMVYKPRDLMHCFAIINRASRRGAPATDNNLTVNQTIVNLQIPRQVVRNFTINQQGEVIDVATGGTTSSDSEHRQTLVTMPSHELLRSLAARSTEGEQDGHREDRKGDRPDYAKVSRYLPGHSLSSK